MPKDSIHDYSVSMFKLKMMLHSWDIQFCISIKSFTNKIYEIIMRMIIHDEIHFSLHLLSHIYLVKNNRSTSRVMVNTSRHLQWNVWELKTSYLAIFKFRKAQILLYLFKSAHTNHQTTGFQTVSDGHIDFHDILHTS